MSAKSNRQQAIRELIQAEAIETQEELADRLGKMGLQVTQATVSRDIREMQLSKRVRENGKQCYSLPGQDGSLLGERGTRVLKEGFVSMSPAQNLLVIRTATGMAMAVAAALDDLKLPQIIGCIAGDDTIMAAVRTSDDSEIVMKQIETVIRSL